MSTIELPRYESRGLPLPAAAPGARSEWSALTTILAPLASLKLTVPLLAMSVFLVLAGTVAQIDRDVWYVVREYFRTWVAWIPLQIFLPRSMGLSNSIGFYFPGGIAIGLALAINLVAAHAVRFKIVAQGKRLWSGVALVVIGIAITWAVIVGGSQLAAETEISASLAEVLWQTLRTGVGAAAATGFYILAVMRPRAFQSQARWLWWIGVAASTLLTGLAVWLFTHPEAKLDPSGLRILWQLAKAAGASIILGSGCWLLFGKRAGIVLLHSGIGLLMFSELATARFAVESQMRIAEGQTVGFAEDARSAELVIADLSDPLRDRNVIVPAKLLEEAAASGQVLEDPALPYALRVVEYLPSASTRLLQPGETAEATAGRGRYSTLVPAALQTGVSSQSSFDIPGAYVELLAKSESSGGKDRKSFGTYLLSPFQLPDAIQDDARRADVMLRFKRVEKPYSVKLLDFKFDRYAGSDTPKNFESVVQFSDPGRHVNRTARIWMNNPLRYAGDTLYQADWDKRTERGTVLQVVTNAGWMIPYVACVIVAVGMLVHFGQAIIRFVGRREQESRLLAGDAAQPLAPSLHPGLLSRWKRPQVWVPALVVALAATTTARYAAPAKDKLTELRISEFGELPVAYGGRTQPLDTLASNMLRMVSGKASYEDSRFDRRQPAIRWLLDVVSRSPEFADHRVVRVENLEVLDALGLPRRTGVWRYSLRELLGKDGELQRQARLAFETPENDRDIVQQKFLETNAKVQQVLALASAFNVPDFGDSAADLRERLPEIQSTIDQLNVSAPRVVPPSTPDGPWMTLYEGAFRLVSDAVQKGASPPKTNPTSLMVHMLDAYKGGDVGDFNATLDEYRQTLGTLARAEAAYESTAASEGKMSRKSAERLAPERIAYEAWYNQFDPLYICCIFYLVAFVLSSLAWLGWSEGFNRSANWLLWFTFALHTFGLISRIYMSGRPPITNLYSVAVFIGWAAVLFSLVFESIYRLGLGNLMAASMGFPTLVISFYLSDGGSDTLGVMQAVLDTNFWLATHVVCINLGCATTLLAGGMGMLYLLAGEIAGKLDDDARRQLMRMIYGTLCFATFFSFIGTILGGLWADDSWGRFWGWDPKENGALMVVLWNALALHARWGKMCGPRGLASLAVCGNIVTAWCLWGVNQMGVGLHSYGWTAGVVLALAVFITSQLAIIGGTYLVAAMRSKPNSPSSSPAAV